MTARINTRKQGVSVMQVVSHPGEVDPQPLDSCRYAAQQLWSAALQSEERQNNFQRGGSKLYTTSAVPERAVQVTIVAWPRRSSAERCGAERPGDAHRWALCLKGCPSA